MIIDTLRSLVQKQQQLYFGYENKNYKKKGQKQFSDDGLFFNNLYLRSKQIFISEKRMCVSQIKLC
ncbi:unnamed protein product [Paramecium octaurelia]|uniref:Uncharacterized protein n=1 Tax=Paramecium octaurelia TaxID=43137 RepID=A0A8S1UMG5_PAROT|nr:unnamed protein product [Paramecium octaurelia]